jgi:hypothetical protein
MMNLRGDKVPVKLTSIEKETVILFNECESDAEVYTFNGKLKRKLQKVAKQYPEIYKLKHDDVYGSVTCNFPKSFLSVSFKKPVSENRKLQLREQALKNKPHLAISMEKTTDFED